MADWENVQPDEYQLLGCNYSAGRPWGIDSITIHHMAGDLSAETCNNVWRNAGTSAHYTVDKNGKIVQHVNDSDRAWACGDGVGVNSPGNDRSISIEHANDMSNKWTVHAAAIESGAHLVAALCKYYNLGRPEWDVNVFPHKHRSATSCLPVNTTELLTHDGWKLLKDIELGEEVASARMDDLGIVWCPVRNIVEEYKSDCWLSRDLEATADHRILAFNPNHTECVLPWKDVCGCSKKESTKYFYIPNAGFMEGEGLPISDAELELIIAVQADGHYSRDGRRDNALENVRFHLKKERKIERLLDILDTTGYKYSVNIKKDGSTDIIINKSLHNFVEQYLDDKKFTIEFGLKLNKHQQELFLDRILDWDGCRAGNYYSSVLQQNLDVVQMIAALSGVGTRSDETKVYFTKQYRTVSDANAKRCYDRKVSCVTVDTSFILIRQHGRTTIVGNCPGELFGSQKDAYMKRCQEWYDAMVNGTDAGEAPAVPTTPSTPSAPAHNEEAASSQIVPTNIYYALRTIDGEWLSTVKNFGEGDDGFAGIPNGKHDLMIAWVDNGSLKYQVHTINHGWLPYIDHADMNDTENGCAGWPGDPIDGVRMYFQTPGGQEYQQVWYRTQTTDRAGWLDVVCDDGGSIAGYTDDYAGIYGEPLDRLQACISDNDPF